jgi:transposase-like protein
MAITITTTLTCPHCTSPQLVKYGFAPDGRQRYRCRNCGKQHRDSPRSNAYTPHEQDTILNAYQERSSLRGLTRTFGVSRQTVTSWIKKKRLASPS